VLFGSVLAQKKDVKKKATKPGLGFLSLDE
jgi:hypothetical protein